MTDSDFHPPDAEVGNEDVKCPACGSVSRADGMALTIDREDMDEDGAVLSTTRYYLCGEECATALFFTD